LEPADDGGFGLTVAYLRRPAGVPGGICVVGAQYYGERTGRVLAFDVGSGALLWAREGRDREDELGRSLATLRDQDRDGVEDLLVGSPHARSGEEGRCGKVLALSGATGKVLREFAGTRADRSFGSSIEAGADVDGDGAADIVVGAPGSGNSKELRRGAVHLFSGADGRLVRRFAGSPDLLDLGRSVCGVASRGREARGAVLALSSGDIHAADEGTGAIARFDPASGTVETVVRPPAGQSVEVGVFPVGDADRDGEDEIVFPMLGKEHFLQACGVRTGKRAPVRWSAGRMGLVRGIVDVDGDGLAEIALQESRETPGTRKAVVSFLDLRDGRTHCAAEGDAGDADPDVTRYGYGMASVAGVPGPGSRRCVEVLVGWVGPYGKSGGHVDVVGVADGKRRLRLTAGE
jgi:hypothetical protein